MAALVEHAHMGSVSMALEAGAGGAAADAGGLSRYYQSKLDELELIVREKANNLRRLEAQRNAMNTKGANRAPP